MKLRAITAAGLALSLSACTTTGLSENSAEAFWAGKPAGGFFAKFGPPNSDSAEGDYTVYAWRGGFARRTIPAQYAEGSDGKRGKQIAPARTLSLSCSVRLKVSSDYVIRSLQIVSDQTLAGGKSYCSELLTGA